MLVEQGVIDDNFFYGRNLLERLGGLMSYLSEEQLSHLLKEDINIIKNKKTGVILGAYITTLNITLNEPCTPQELVGLGMSCGKAFKEDLVCKTEREQDVRGKALHAIMGSQLALCAYLCTIRFFRKKGLATILKAITFHNYLQKNITHGLVDIFSIEGVYKRIGGNVNAENSYERIHKFQNPIKNIGSLSLNKKITECMGYVPVYKKALEMLDGSYTREKVKKFISRYGAISSEELENYYVRIDDVYYLIDFARAMEHLKQKINEK